MIAVVHADPVLLDEMWELTEGQRVEVVGWVHRDSMLWAVIRDDYGVAREVPSWTLRLLPSVITVET